QSLSLWYRCIARPICLRLLAQLMRLAASRAFCTAGNNIPINTEMMAMTTNSSISVNALRADMTCLLTCDRSRAKRTCEQPADVELDLLGRDSEGGPGQVQPQRVGFRGRGDEQQSHLGGVAGHHPVKGLAQLRRPARLEGRRLELLARRVGQAQAVGLAG